MKTVTVLFRSAAVLLCAFAAGHTFGFLRFRPASREALAVYDAMRDVHFVVGGSSFTYGGFYVGFGLFVTAYLLFSALLAWQLGALASQRTKGVGAMAWSLCAVQVVSLVLSATFFSAPPAVFSALVAACLGAAAWKATAREGLAVGMLEGESA